MADTSNWRTGFEGYDEWKKQIDDALVDKGIHGFTTQHYQWGSAWMLGLTVDEVVSEILSVDAGMKKMGWIKNEEKQ